MQTHRKSREIAADEAEEPGETALSSALSVTLVDAMEPLEAEWRRLESDPLNSLHHSYDWCAGWHQAFGHPLAIVKGMIGGRLAFILPLEIVPVARLRVARFIAAPHSNINTGLFSAGFTDWAGANPIQAAAQIKAGLRDAFRGRADLVLFENLPSNWRGRKNPLCLLPAVRNQNSAYQLPLKPNLQETLSQLNAKTRKRRFRIQSKRLAELGGFEYLSPEPSTEDQHRLLDLFFEQKAHRLRSMGFKNVFADDRVRAFLHAALDPSGKATGAFRLEMHALRLKGVHEGHIAAIAGIARKGDHVICEFSSIDDSVAKDASPGEFLFWQMIAGMHASPVALFDFGIGDQSYKRSWAPQETPHYDARLALTAIGLVGSYAYHAQATAKRLIKTNAGLYGFVQRLRTRLTS